MASNFSDCLNGGSLLARTSRNASSGCFCPTFFTGPLCESFLCENGGIANGSQCLCPDLIHFNGSRCERLLCENGGIDTGFGFCSCSSFRAGDFCEKISRLVTGVAGIIILLLLFTIVAFIFCQKLGGGQGSTPDKSVHIERCFTQYNQYLDRARRINPIYSSLFQSNRARL